MAKWTGSKPGGPQQEHLIPLTERPPEEAKAIRSKGGKAAQKKRREKERLSEIVRCVLAMGLSSGKVKDPNDLYTLEDAENANVPVQTLIVMREVRKYLNEGNTESRNWLFEHAFPNGDDTPASMTGSTDAPSDADDSSADGVRIHLIRGEKPQVEVSEEDAATRAAARLATLEAMKAVGEALQEEHEKRRAEVEVTPDDG